MNLAAMSLINTAGSINTICEGFNPTDLIALVHDYLDTAQIMQLFDLNGVFALGLEVLSYIVLAAEKYVRVVNLQEFDAFFVNARTFCNKIEFTCLQDFFVGFSI